MKKKILLLAGMAAMLAFGSDAFAAAEGTATATIGGAIAITQIPAGSGVTGVGPGGNLAFGYIIPSGSAGTVVISTTGSPTYTNVTGTGALTRGAAQFQAEGVANATYTVAVSSSAAISDGALPVAHTMTVDNFTKSAISPLGADGKATFTVGGTLNVAASQAAGSYTGTFDVTATYQ